MDVKGIEYFTEENGLAHAIQILGSLPFLIKYVFEHKEEIILDIKEDNRGSPSDIVGKMLADYKHKVENYGFEGNSCEVWLRLQILEGLSRLVSSDKSHPESTQARYFLLTKF